MLIKVKLNFGLKNGDTKEIEVGEKDPTGILRDKATGEEREITLTEKEVLMEYTKRVSTNIEEEKTLFFMGLDQKVLILNPNEVASVELTSSVEVGG